MTPYQMGLQAYRTDIKRAPALDKKLMNHIDGLQVGESLPALKAWLDGWDKAHLAVIELVEF